MQHHAGAPALIALQGGKTLTRKKGRDVGAAPIPPEFERGDLVLAWNSIAEKEQETKDWWMGEVIGLNQPAATRHVASMIQIACIETGTIRWLPPSHLTKVNLPINLHTSIQN